MSSIPVRECCLHVSLAEHLAAVQQLEAQLPIVESIARVITNALCAGQKILWCGNGGSAADAQHLNAELVGRFRSERLPFASLALTTDTSILTAVANDYGYESVFARQVQALGNPGDVLVGISTSGNSANVIAAIKAARSRGLVTIAFTGAAGGRLASLADHSLHVNSLDTARIQETHILAGHMLCEWIEAALATEDLQSHRLAAASPAA